MSNNKKNDLVKSDWTKGGLAVRRKNQQLVESRSLDKPRPILYECRSPVDSYRWQDAWYYSIPGADAKGAQTWIGFLMDGTVNGVRCASSIQHGRCLVDDKLSDVQMM